MLTKYSIVSHMLIFLSKISRRNETVGFQKRILAGHISKDFTLDVNIVTHTI